jgi:hypothetical protein
MISPQSSPHRVTPAYEESSLRDRDLGLLLLLAGVSWARPHRGRLFAALDGFIAALLLGVVALSTNPLRLDIRRT